MSKDVTANDATYRPLNGSAYPGRKFTPIECR